MEKKDYLIVIGTVAIMLSHNISTLLIAGISVIYVLINITKLKEKRVWLKLLIDAVFVLQLLDSFMDHYWKANYHLIMQHLMKVFQCQKMNYQSKYYI